tara:strand:- start:10052 stop:10306 length:255 start_codon:yes stop_codon:yes gene_type:complete
MNEIEINNKIQDVLYNSVRVRNLVIKAIPEEDIEDVANELTTLVMNNFVLDNVIQCTQFQNSLTSSSATKCVCGKEKYEHEYIG